MQGGGTGGIHRHNLGVRHTVFVRAGAGGKAVDPAVRELIKPRLGIQQAHPAAGAAQCLLQIRQRLHIAPAKHGGKLLHFVVDQPRQTVAVKAANAGGQRVKAFFYGIAGNHTRSPSTGQRLR